MKRVAWLAACMLMACGPEWGEVLPADELLPVEEAVTPSKSLAERAYALDDPAYRFCHEAGPYSEDIRPWCAVENRVAPQRCPGFHELCSRPSDEDVPTQLGGGCAGGMGGPPTVPAGAPEPPAEAEQDWTPSSAACDSPDSSLGWLGRILGWVVAGIIALSALVVLRLVLWGIAQRRRTPDDAPPRPTEAPVLTSVDDDEVPDVPTTDLLHAAESALGEGRNHDAILLARAAALRHLGDNGALQLHRSRTDREYLRALRRQTDVHGPLAFVLNGVERLRWGGDKPTSEHARAVLSAVRKLVAASAMLVLAIVALGADASYRYGPHGDAGLADLYARAGYDVTWRLRSLATIDEATDVLVVDLAGIEPGDGDWSAIRGWVRDGGVLIVGGPAEMAFPRLGEAVRAPVSQARAIGDVQGPVFIDAQAYGWSSGEDTDVVYDPGSGTAFVSGLQLQEGVVYAIGDARLLWNGSLLAEDNEDFLLDLVALGLGDVEAREDVHIQLALVASAGSDNPMQTLWKARLLPLMLQVMLLMALAALWLGWPFAPLRDPARSERQRFADHVAALGGRYRRLGARPWVTRTYARWALTRYGTAGLVSRAEREGRTHQQAKAWVDRVRALAEGEADAGSNMTLEDLWKTTHQE